MNLINRLQREQKLRIELWQKVKEDWKPAIMDEHHFTDNNNKIIAGKIDGVHTIIGYYHFEHAQGNELLAVDLLIKLNAFSKQISNIVVTNKWYPIKMLIITPYKLSSFPHFDIDKLDYYGKMFCFLTTYPNYDKKNFMLQKDEVVLQRLQVEMFLQKVMQEP